jgi:hypothetical protein
VTAAAVYALLAWQLNLGRGLRQTFFEGVAADRSAVIERVTRTIDLSLLQEDDSLPRRFFSVRWSGFWWIPQRGLYDISVRGDDRVVLSIDGYEVHSHSAGAVVENPRTLPLERGFHGIAVVFEQYGGTSGLSIAWAPTGEVLQPLETAHLFPSPPSSHRVRAALVSLQWIVGVLGLAALTGVVYSGALLLMPTARRLLAEWISPATASVIKRIVGYGVPVLIVGYAAGLRFDAITLKYPVDRPAWLQVVQQRSHAPLAALRPERIAWSPIPDRPHPDGPPSPYISDPYTFLGFARAMPYFYAATTESRCSPSRQSSS